MTALAVHTTAIPGLLIVDLPVHGDVRGWFKENWQRAKMTALGLPDFGPVQHNLAFNAERGVARGVHAEPWDKYVSVATGRIFGAWVDLREGPSYGRVVTAEVTPEKAVYVPRGVGNSYQTLEPGTVYTYLVNEHWQADAKDRYAFVSITDPALGIDWPIPLDQCVLSEADQTHPPLASTTPARPGRILVLGAGGQLGRALIDRLPAALAASDPADRDDSTATTTPRAHSTIRVVPLTRAEADLADPTWAERVDLSDVEIIVNAAAYTHVDAAETPEGRREAWATNVTGVGHLVRVCRERRIPLVHLSSDYVFDGTVHEHGEDEPFSPLGVYGQTKAAGDALVTTLDRHFIVRTSWVVGDGPNFVATMARLADEGASPSVVHDQYGRLTHTATLADAIGHLIATGAPWGTYNVTDSGPTRSWADIAAEVFARAGRDPADVRPVSTTEYEEQQRAAGKHPAPRPRHSTLTLDKIRATGFAVPQPMTGRKGETPPSRRTPQ